MGIQFGRKKNTPHRRFLSAIRQGGVFEGLRKAEERRGLVPRETKENLFSEIVSVMM